MTDFVSSGIAELDKLLGGGMVKGRNYLLEVEPGVQELAFVSAYLREGLSQREACSIMVFDLPGAEIISRFADIGLDLRKLLNSGLFIIGDLWTEGKYDPERRGPILVTDNPTDINSILRLATDMTMIGHERLGKGGFKGGRSAILSVSSHIMNSKFEAVYKMSKKSLRFAAELSALSLVVFHPKMFDQTIVSAMELLYDGTIVLGIREVGGKYLRFVRVKQSPASGFDIDEHRYNVIDNKPVIDI